MMFDREMAQQVETMLLEDLEVAREVDKALKDQPWNIQLFSPMARLLAPIL